VASTLTSPLEECVQMFSRFVIVIMLMLFPVQWSAAQAHEVGDDVGAISAITVGIAGVSQHLIHTNEPGGICQFHELSQPAAMFVACDAADWPIVTGKTWTISDYVTPQGSRSPSEIERPKWGFRQYLAAIS